MFNGEDVTTQSIKETQALIDEKLGINQQVLARTLFHGQHAMNELLEATDAHIKEELSLVTPLTSWQEAVSEARKLGRTASKRVAEVEGMISIRSGDLEESQRRLEVEVDALRSAELAFAEVQSEYKKNVQQLANSGKGSISEDKSMNLEAAQKNLDLIQRQVVENTRNLYIAINTDVARVRARLRGIESSQSALDATQTGYEVGTRNIVDVLNAQRNLFLSQFQYASARHLYVLDTLRLKQIVGTLSPQDLYDLNQFIDSGIVVSRTTPTTR